MIWPGRGDRGADRAGRGRARRLEAVHEDPVARVLDVEEHRGPAREVPGVDRDGLVARQQVGERDREVARVDVAVRGRRPRTARRASARAASCARAPRRCGSRSPRARGRRARRPAPPRRAPASPTTPRSTRRFAPIARGSTSTWIDARLRADERAVARRPVVERRAEREDDVGLRRAARRRPARRTRPRCRSAHGSPCEHPLRHRAVGQQRAARSPSAAIAGPAPAERRRRGRR